MAVPQSSHNPDQAQRVAQGPTQAHIQGEDQRGRLATQKLTWPADQARTVAQGPTQADSQTSSEWLCLNPHLIHRPGTNGGARPHTSCHSDERMSMAVPEPSKPAGPQTRHKQDCRCLQRPKNRACSQW